MIRDEVGIFYRLENDIVYLYENNDSTLKVTAMLSVIEFILCRICLLLYSIACKNERFNKLRIITVEFL